MKLTEARYAADPEVVWVQDLEYNDIVEYDDAPFVDPKTGILVIAIDAKWEGAYVNPQTFNYEETKLELPWSVELAGTRAQIEQFLNLYFPHWEEDQLIVSPVWDKEGIERVVKHVQNKKIIMSRNLDEQVSRILEAKYHHEPSPKEVHEMYVEVFEREQQRQFGSIIMVEHDYVDDGIFGVENKCYAVLYLWVIDSTRTDAEEEVAGFMKEMNLPYHDIDLDVGVLKAHNPSFKYGRIHTSVMYIGPCEDNVTEAKHIGPTKTTSVMRHQVWNLYNQHTTSSGTRAQPHIQARQKQMWPRETTAGDPGIIPMISLWYDVTKSGRKYPESKIQAEKDAKQYMKDNNLPYTSFHTSSKFGASAIQVVFSFGERKDLSEARYKIDHVDVHYVLREYERIERKIREMNTEGYGYYDSEETGRVTHIHPNIDVEHNPSPTAEMGLLIHRCDNQQQADDRLYAFIRKFNIPYNDIEYGQDTGDKKFAFILQYRNPTTDPTTRIIEARYHGLHPIVLQIKAYVDNDVNINRADDFTTIKAGEEQVVFQDMTKVFGEPEIQQNVIPKGTLPRWFAKSKTYHYEFDAGHDDQPEYADAPYGLNLYSAMNPIREASYAIADPILDKIVKGVRKGVEKEWFVDQPEEDVIELISSHFGKPAKTIWGDPKLTYWELKELELVVISYGDRSDVWVAIEREQLHEARYHGGDHVELRKHIISLVDGYGYEDFDARWFEMEVRKGPEEIIPILTKHFGKPRVKEMNDNKGYTWQIPGRGKINMLTWVGRQTHNELDSVEAFYHYDNQLR